MGYRLGDCARDGGCSPTVTQCRKGLAESSLSTFIFPVARLHPLRFCRDFSPCSIELPKPPLRLRLWRPLRLFQAGLIAGCVQAGLVCVMTPMVMVFAQYRDHDPGASGRSPAAMLIAFLPLIYATLAAWPGLYKAPLCDVDDCANSPRIPPHVVFRSGSFSRHALHCHFLASIGCASYALQPPPDILVALDVYLGPTPAAPILWSALMSVCVAGFGANAHAATDAAY